MSKDYGPNAIIKYDPAYADHPEFQKSNSMGITNENVCDKFGIQERLRTALPLHHSTRQKLLKIQESLRMKFCQ